MEVDLLQNQEEECRHCQRHLNGTTMRILLEGDLGLLIQLVKETPQTKTAFPELRETEVYGSIKTESYDSSIFALNQIYTGNRCKIYFRCEFYLV